MCVVYNVVFVVFVFPIGTGRDPDGASVTERITTNRKERCVLMHLVLVVLSKPYKYFYLYCG